MHGADVYVLLLFPNPHLAVCSACLTSSSSSEAFQWWTLLCMGLFVPQQRMAVGRHNKIHGQAAALEPGVTYTAKYHAPQTMNIFKH